MICQYIETKKEEFGAWPVCKVLTGAGVKIAPSTWLTPAVAGLLAPGACATRILKAEIRRVHENQLLGAGGPQDARDAGPP